MAIKGARGQTPKHRRFTDAAETCESVIGHDVSIKGDVVGTTDMEFRGSLEGNLDLDGFLWLRQDGRVEGNLSATDLLVEGEVRGEIRVSGKVELRSSCHVEGNISAQGVAIGEGGFFEGTITMAGKPSSPDDVKFKERRSNEG
jgi:cytoskeletal protein CcmA (bactofilin family)